MMLAAQIIETARESGLTLSVTTNGKVRFTPTDRMTQELMDSIRTHKDEIVSLLLEDAPGWTPPPTPPAPWTAEQWEAFCDLVAILERTPQAWAGLRKFAQKTLHRDLFQALVREGYGGRAPVPVTDLPRNGRVKCKECSKVDHCPLPEAKRQAGTETLHLCREFESC